MNNRLFALLVLTSLASGCVDGLDDGTDDFGKAAASCPDMGDNASAFVAPTYPDDEPEGALRSAAMDWAIAEAKIADPRLNDGQQLVVDPSLAFEAIVGAPIGGGADTEGPTDVPGDEPATGEPTTGEPTTGEPTTGEPTTGEPTADPAETQQPEEVVDPADQPDPIFATPYDASVDPLQAVPMSMVDMSKDFVWTPQFVIPAAMTNFTTLGLQPGEKVPDFTLWNLEGKQVMLSQYKGVSNVAIIMGSASCMVFRRESLSMWSALQQIAANAMAKSGKKLEILVVFTKEAHPAAENSVYLDQQWLGIENVEDKVLVSMSKTFAERVTLARGLDARFKLDKPNVWIDGMDDAVWKLLGSVPNGMFLIDMQGHLAWKELWAMHAGMEGDYGAPPNPNAKPTAFSMIEKLLGL